jgi:hypothetical protein
MCLELIDIENIVFTRLATEIRTAYPDTSVYGEYVEVPATFPSVSIVEADNRVVERTRDLDGVEHYAQLMYEINIYTNDASGKKTKAKAIAELIDGIMSEMLFTRTFRGQTPNVDRSIYRISLRYEAIVSEAIDHGNKIVHIMHTTY